MTMNHLIPQAVDSIRDILDAPLYVKECMVDRICSDMKIEGNSVSNEDSYPPSMCSSTVTP